VILAGAVVGSQCFVRKRHSPPGFSPDAEGPVELGETVPVHPTQVSLIGVVHSLVGGIRRDCSGRNGGDDETRTRDLCRDSIAWIGFTTTYKTAGTAKVRLRRTRPHELWVGLWVGDLPSPAARKISPFRTWTSVKPCTRLRYAAHGKHKLAQVSGFRDQETEVGNSKIRT
jgi:hypothetical protein